MIGANDFPGPSPPTRRPRFPCAGREAGPRSPAYPRTITTSRVRGPWTPSTRSSSMSLVALGPLIQVCGRVPSSRRRASGRMAVMSPARTMQMCRSGTRLMTRRPWSGPASRMMVPVSATATALPVTTASIPSSSSTLSRLPGGVGDAAAGAAVVRVRLREQRLVEAVRHGVAAGALEQRGEPLRHRGGFLDEDVRLVVDEPVRQQLDELFLAQPGGCAGSRGAPPVPPGRPGGRSGSGRVFLRARSRVLLCSG